MKIKEILKEDTTDIVARFYKESSADSERFYNPEVVKYKEKNHKYYDEFFEKWFDDEIVPVFVKPTTKAQPEYTNTPKQGKIQSPGYRGLQYALASAGLPYNHSVQRYRSDPSRALASQTMDATRNNNGQ
jgi:hypothetical protein